jgi:hypothetical protein
MTSIGRADVGTVGTLRLFRLMLLGGIALNLILIGARVLLYLPLLAQRDAVAFVLEPVVLLLVYAAIVLAVTSTPSLDRRVALYEGAAVGLLTGALWIFNLALETFFDLSSRVGLLATAPFLLGAFALWGAAGFRGAWRTRSVPLGVLAAIVSAMICVLLTVTFGFLLTYTSLPWLERILATDPDFLRSGWRDVRAFAIANAFDSGFSHLLGGLIVGALVGTVGGLAGLLASRRQRQGLP